MIKNALQILLFSFPLLCTSCVSYSMMTKPDYDMIAIGTPVEVLKERVGEPFRVIQEKDGSQTFRYIERIEIAPGVFDQRTYGIRIRNGIVVEKSNLSGTKPFDVRF